MQLRSSVASRLVLILALLIGSVAVSGCGQKGPLKLPNPQTPAPAGAASTPGQ